MSSAKDISKDITKGQLLSGTTFIAVAEALMLPTGFLTVVFLTRELGPEGYGLFAIAATIITWIEWGINSVFSRTTIKFVGESDDWQAVATTVLRTQLGFSVLAAGLLAVAAPAISIFLREPMLMPFLWLFALEIPLFNLVQAHQNILTGLGRFTPRAVVSACRWTGRLLLIVAMVKGGLAILGAIAGSLLALVISLAVCRCYIRPAFWQASQFPARQLAGYGLPLFVSALAVRLYGSVDLIALKALGGSDYQTGLYAVAQNLALLGNVLTPALVPVLLAKITQLASQQQLGSVQAISRGAMRLVMLQFPLAGVVVGAADEIVPGLFGEVYRGAAPLFAILFVTSVVGVMIGVTSTILIASDKPQWTVTFSAPMPIVAVVGHWLLIPWLGPVGAAIASLLVASTGAIAGIVAVYLRWQVLPPFKTFGRCCFTFALMVAAAAAWPSPGLWLWLKLPTLGLLSLLVLYGLGELTAQDKALARSFFL